VEIRIAEWRRVVSGHRLELDLSADVLEQLAQRVAEILDDRQASRSSSGRARWLTVDQAAEYIGAKRQRIYDLRSSRVLSRHCDGRRGLVDRSELDRLIERGAGV
jgi:excisionase family DNA binding protein